MERAPDRKALIRDSGFFDAAWYLRSYPDVGRLGVDAFDHFWLLGRWLGRSPSALFDSAHYLAQGGLIDPAHGDPLSDYLMAGRAAGRRPRAALGRVALVVHVFHLDVLDDLAAHAAHLGAGCDRYVTCPQGLGTGDRARIVAAFPGARLVAVPNAGQDVGALVALGRQVDLGAYEVVCKIHSKKGGKEPQRWRQALLAGVLGHPAQAALILRAFEGDPRLILAGPRQLYLHGPSHLRGNAAGLGQTFAALIGDFDYRTRDWGFVAGTCFWIRGLVLAEVLACLDPALFAPGAAYAEDATPAHQAERMFGLIATLRGGRVLLTDATDPTRTEVVAAGFPEGLPRQMQRVTAILDAIDAGTAAAGPHSGRGAPRPALPGSPAGTAAAPGVPAPEKLAPLEPLEGRGTAPPTPARVAGAITACEAAAVIGWVAVPGDPARRAALIRIGGHTLRAEAGDHRPALRDLGLAEGWHGFVAPVPLALCDGQPHEVILQDAASGAELARATGRWDRPRRDWQDFQGFLAASMTQPEVRAPFVEADKRVLAVMEGIADRLERRGLALAGPAASGIAGADPAASGRIPADGPAPGLAAFDLAPPDVAGANCAAPDPAAPDPPAPGLAASGPPLVSVVMAVFDRAGMVGQAIASVLGQSWRHLELIVVDDGSTDGTADAVRAIADPRLRLVVLADNGGVTRARNRGLAEARGSVIAYLDSDNAWDPRYLAAHLGALADLPGAEMIYSGVLLYNGENAQPDGIRYGHLHPGLIENRNYVDMNALVHRRSLLDRIGGFDQGLRRYVDWDLVLRAMDAATVVSVPVLLCHYHYYRHENTLTGRAAHAGDIEVLRASLARRVARAGARLAAQPLLRPVSVVIPNWQALEDLRDCLAALQGDWGGLLEIIVADNASDPPVQEMLRAEAAAGRITWLPLDRNYGFTHAANAGIARARPDADILLLNNDAIAWPGAVQALQQACLGRPDAGMVVPRQILPGGTATLRTHVPFARPGQDCDVNLSAHHRNVGPLALFHDGGLVEVTYAPFFAVYIRRAVLDAIGPLDAAHGRHYRSDRVYCDMMRNLTGWRMFQAPQARFTHRLQRATADLQARDRAGFEVIYRQNRWDAATAAALGYRTAAWDLG